MTVPKSATTLKRDFVFAVGVAWRLYKKERGSDPNFEMPG